jgi:hypothetical protein
VSAVGGDDEGRSVFSAAREADPRDAPCGSNEIAHSFAADQTDPRSGRDAAPQGLDERGVLESEPWPRRLGVLKVGRSVVIRGEDREARYAHRTRCDERIEEP